MRVLFLIFSLAALTSPALAADAPRKKLNVLFIISDDLKPLLGCYGTSWIQSPHLDRLAAKGTVFTANYCQVAFCAPTRFSLLTGLRPDSTGVYLNPDQSQDLLRTRLPDVVTLPQQFKNHGYITHPLHKVFDGRTVDQGHDSASWTVPYGPWEMAPGEKPAPGGYQAPATKAQLADALKQGKPISGPATEACDIADNAYHDGGVAHTAAKRIREFAKKEQPFFLAVGFVKPHLPFIAPKKYWDLYERDRLPPVEATRPAHAPAIAFHESTEILGPPDRQAPLSPEEIAELRHGYLAGISYLDAQVGRVLDALERTGRASDTIVVFVSDHGFHLGEHGLWAKTSNFELDAHVPLLIADPRIGHGGRKTRGIVELVDIFPTLVDACGLPAPPGLEGTCLMPIVRGQPKAAGEAAFTQHPRPAYFDRGAVKQPEAMGYSIRTDRVRYTEWRDYATGTVIARELYDHTADAAELRNAIDDPRLAPSRREAERRLHGQFPSTVGGPSLQSQGFKTED